MLQLDQEYSFWIGTYVKGNYTQQQVASFSTADDFWGYHQHIVKPEQLPEGTQLFLFKKDIQPAWEHESNKKGGRFLFRVRKTLANKIFEDLMMLFIANDCPAHEYINGVVSVTKKGCVQMAVWVKDFQKQLDGYSQLQKWIKESVLSLKEDREIEFVFHPQN